LGAAGSQVFGSRQRLFTGVLFSLLPVLFLGFRVLWVAVFRVLAEQGGGRAAKFGRLFLSPPRQFSPAVGHHSFLAGFRPAFLFSEVTVFSLVAKW